MVTAHSFQKMEDARVGTQLSSSWFVVFYSSGGKPNDSSRLWGWYISESSISICSLDDFKLQPGNPDECVIIARYHPQAFLGFAHVRLEFQIESQCIKRMKFNTVSSLLKLVTKDVSIALKYAIDWVKMFVVIFFSQVIFSDLAFPGTVTLVAVPGKELPGSVSIRAFGHFIYFVFYLSGKGLFLKARW